MTKDGDDVYRHCQFPFTYQGKQYSACKLDHSSGKFWCATLVNPNTNEMVDEKHGFCEAGCPTENDEQDLHKLDCKDLTIWCPLLKPQCAREKVKNSCRKTCNNCIGHGKQYFSQYFDFFNLLYLIYAGFFKKKSLISFL